MEMSIVRITDNSHWEYSKGKYGKYIYKVLQFVKSSNNNTYAILQPFLKSDWGAIDITTKSDYGYWDINPRKLIEVEIIYLEIIHHSEISEDVIRDFKLSSLGIQ